MGLGVGLFQTLADASAVGSQLGIGRVGAPGQRCPEEDYVESLAGFGASGEIGEIGCGVKLRRGNKRHQDKHNRAGHGPDCFHRQLHFQAERVNEGKGGHWVTFYGDAAPGGVEGWSGTRSLRR